MLRVNFTIQNGAKKLEKRLKTCHVGTHIVSESYNEYQHDRV